MTDAALAVLRTVNNTNRVETIVIADQPSPAVRKIVGSYASRWDGPLRLLDLALPEKILLPRLGDPGKNHPAQLLRGATATLASHVVFHDADLFPLDPDLHEAAWAACVDPGVDVAGIDKAWDAWFADRGRDLIATWEMCCRVDWLRSFAPWRHFAHEVATDGGEPHVFDTTFEPQWCTPQERLAITDPLPEFVHFNYVISTYRNFQRSSTPFRDRHFRLLLLRVMADVFGDSEQLPDIPTLHELQSSINDTSSRVHHVDEDAPRFFAMAGKLRKIVEGEWAAANKGKVEQHLDVFEQWARRVRTDA
ncbi:hypothetical protein [uncultured Jatrophihabitans sp.]|uniref:hypothetical protein n=1 Tax=uncultured Jatrophihabitans sp. TaxID=1610747 RepID=UPI0035CC077D